MQLTKFHKVLFGVLAVQVVLVFVILFTGGDTTLAKEVPLLPTLDAATVTRIQIFSSESGAKPIDLVKSDKGWKLASGYNYPVDGDKVEKLLSPITKMAAADPIAKQATRHKQLKVADDEFDRKVVLTAGSTDTVVFIGQPTGNSRGTPVRLAGDERVFGVKGVSAFIAPADAKSWIDASYATYKPEEITGITIARDASSPIAGPIEIDLADSVASTGAGSGSGSGSDAGSGSGSGSAGSGSAAKPTTSVPIKPKWIVKVGGVQVVPGPDEKLNADVIEQLYNSTATFEASGPADPKRSDPANTITLTLRRKDKPPVSYEILPDPAGWWFKEKDRDQAITLPKQRLAVFVDLTRDMLTKKINAKSDTNSAPGVDTPPEGAGSGAAPVVPPPPGGGSGSAGAGPAKKP